MHIYLGICICIGTIGTTVFCRPVMENYGRQ